MSILRRAEHASKALLNYAATRFDQRPLLWIITFHRVLPVDDPRYQLEEPGMVITPERFERQMRFFARRFETIHLDDWILREVNDAHRALA